LAAGGALRLRGILVPEWLVWTRYSAENLQKIFDLFILNALGNVEIGSVHSVELTRGFCGTADSERVSASSDVRRCVAPTVGLAIGGLFGVSRVQVEQFGSPQ
jgi:hypothetical protein